MVSPEHVDEQKPENEHVSSPTKEKQELIVDEKKRTWLNPLMRVISVVLALGGSFAAVLVISTSLISIEVFYNVNDFLIMLVILVYAAFCAVLYRSMWATLIIPIALTLPPLLAVFLTTVQEGTGDFFAVFGVLFVTAPALVGAIIGGFFGVAWKERWWW